MIVLFEDGSWIVGNLSGCVPLAPCWDIQSLGIALPFIIVIGAFLLAIIMGIWYIVLKAFWELKHKKGK